MAEPSEKLMSLLRQLRLIMDDKGAFPGEQERAAAHLQRLLLKHQLSMFDVESGVLKEEVVRQDHATGKKKLPGWYTGLANDIAIALDCRLIPGWSDNTKILVIVRWYYRRS